MNTWFIPAIIFAITGIGSLLFLNREEDRIPFECQRLLKIIAYLCIVVACMCMMLAMNIFPDKVEEEANTIVEKVIDM